MRRPFHGGRRHAALTRRTERLGAGRDEMLAVAFLNRYGRLTGRAIRRSACFCGAVQALVVVLPMVALPQRRTSAFVGTWQAMDAVDDNEQPYAIVIKRQGNAYELVDPTMHPRTVRGGKATGGRLTFIQKGSRGTTTCVFTTQTGDRPLAEDVNMGKSHVGVRFARVSRHRK